MFDSIVKMFGSLTLTLAMSCAAVAETGAVRTASDDAQTPNADSAQLQEVVVTAQKRSERLQDVPISISVLGGKSLDHSTVQGVSEALSTVPGVATVQEFEGGGTQVIVRGVTSAGGLYAGPSAVGYYLDALPFGFVRAAIAPDSNAYDLDRVEVLRGPQGTLYGASALNGVVRVLTTEPNLTDFDLKARVSGSHTEGGAGDYRADAAINVPLIDGKLGLRAVVGDQHLSGWVDQPNKSNVNDATVHNYRLKLGAQPTDNLYIGLSAWRSDSDFGAPSTALNNGTINATGPQPYSIVYDAYNLKVAYEAPAVLVSSSTSYLDFINTGLLDLGPLFGKPDYIPYRSSNNSHVFSQEALLNSKADSPWIWSLGGFYRNSGDSNLQYYLSTPIPPDADFVDSSKSYAAFGQFGRRFLNGQLEWTLGLRYFHDDVTTLGSPLKPAQYQGLLSASYHATTPRAVLTWRPASNRTIYVSYSEGFRSGWLQQPPVYIQDPNIPSVKPDKLDNYELGGKADWFDARLSTEVAVYYMKWRDIQQSVSLLDADGKCCITAGLNASSASGVGTDLAITVRPVNGLELAATASWNNLALDSDLTSEGSVYIAKGERPSSSPELTTGGSASYTLALGDTGYNTQFSASVSHISSLPGRALTGTYPALTLVNNPGDPLTLGRADIALNAPQHWTAMIYVDNINNYQRSPTRSYQAFGFSDWDTRVRPRTIGLQLDYRLR